MVTPHRSHTGPPCRLRPPPDPRQDRRYQPDGILAGKLSPSAGHRPQILAPAGAASLHRPGEWLPAITGKNAGCCRLVPAEPGRRPDQAPATAYRGSEDPEEDKEILHRIAGT